MWSPFHFLSFILGVYSLSSFHATQALSDSKAAAIISYRWKRGSEGKPDCDKTGSGNKTCAETGSASVAKENSERARHGDQHTRYEIYAGGKAGSDYYDLESSTGSGKRGEKDPYQKGEGKMWLVPPFLIGASSVIVAYIIMHCLYLHCYAKRKMRQLASRATPTPTIVFSDEASTSSYQPFTPVVKYDGGFGKTELLGTQPFFVCHNTAEATKPQNIPLGVISSDKQKQQNLQPPRKKSMHLQLPSAIARRLSKPRLSTCSANPALETCPTSKEEQEQLKPDQPKPRTSICFVPVGRTISDPAGNSNEWTPLQGFMYPSNVVLARNASYCMACGGAGNSTTSLKQQDTAAVGGTAVEPLIESPQGSPSHADFNIMSRDSSTDSHLQSTAGCK